MSEILSLLILVLGLLRPSVGIAILVIFQESITKTFFNQQMSIMTLSELIINLQSLPPLTTIAKLSNPHSYRGYYEHLAFEIDSSQLMYTSELLDICTKLIDTVMHSYKGGEYDINNSTPVWIAKYGSTGKPLMNVEETGMLSLGQDDY